MKNVLFFVILTFVLFSCASSKLATGKVEQLIPLSLGMIENFGLTPKVFESVQFFSGPDTIILQKSTKVATGSVSDDGTLLLTGGEPVSKIIILPNTPGTVAQQGVVLGIDKKVKALKVSFSEKENNYLIFVPTDDEFGTFVLSQTEAKTVSGGINSFLMIKLFYLEQQDQSKIEPGRVIGQKNQKKTEEIYVPDKKFVRQ